MERILTKNSPEHIGRKIKASGFVRARRDLGKIILIDLRDFSGGLQMVFTPGNKE